MGPCQFEPPKLKGFFGSITPATLIRANVEKPWPCSMKRHPRGYFPVPPKQSSPRRGLK